jgi:hypothetical protein
VFEHHDVLVRGVCFRLSCFSWGSCLVRVSLALFHSLFIQFIVLLVGCAMMFIP